ncbi:hypothetical protein ABZ816_19010 [Actinosynnema sp. NPDC047251]|uniref:Secreted protein n=1 Tax=Saccharothrix espanaensis (strain ATCC 51144 / DSM 44229 / JCM 9112 / NBRC 15066 / NRRL 15764) TaxID=1179773 RepID=K0K8T3_SACES|nr:hypothetical protein [Saccharothrix espanaensis]CCH33249.1 hypothetical protein BN6_59930 [Saccharothrix espanaensis DSM 44229]
MRWLSIPTVSALLVFGAPVAEASAGFEELPTLPDFPSTIVSAVNESGQAVGSAHSRYAHATSVRWDGAGTPPTPTGRAYPTGVNNRGDVLNSSTRKVGGMLLYSVKSWENGAEVERTPAHPTTFAHSSRDINDSGVVPVGYKHFADTGRGTTRAGVWRDGKFADLPLPQAIGVEHQVVNNRGTTAGSLTLLDGTADYAFRCSATRCTRLPGLASTGVHSALALNESDALAGTWRADHNSPTRALLWTGDRVTVLPGDDAGVADNPRAINESGDVVGWRVVDGVREAVLWRGGQAVDLGTSGAGEAVAVNDRGDVAGWHTVEGAPRVFLWRAGTLTDLRTPSDVAAKPVGLNNAGVVVGNNDQRLWPPPRAFRWTVRLP